MFLSTTKTKDFYFTRPSQEFKLKATDSEARIQAQWSTHVVHEMLRLVFDSSRDIALWNRALHNEKFFTTRSTGELVNYLIDMGVMDSPVLLKAETEIEIRRLSNSKGNNCEAIAAYLENLFRNLNSEIANWELDLKRMKQEREVIAKDNQYCSVLKRQIPYLKEYLGRISAIKSKDLVIGLMLNQTSALDEKCTSEFSTAERWITQEHGLFEFIHGQIEDFQNDSTGCNLEENIRAMESKIYLSTHWAVNSMRR